MTVALRVDAVLFDSDGVLVDSHAQVETAWSALADHYGLDFETLRHALVGVPAEQTLGPLLAPDDLEPACALLEDLEVSTSVDTPAIPGAPELVDSLPAGRFAFATSATRRLAAARWSAAGIPIPDHVVTADDVTHGKPDPEPFLAAAALLGVDPGRCVVFEDSDPGGRAAVGAGATVVAVGPRSWSVDPVARVSDLTAVRVAPGTDGFAFTIEIDAAHAT